MSTSAVGTALDESVVDAFEADGVVAIRGALALQWIDLLRAAMPQLLEQTYDPDARAGVDDGGPKILSRDGMWRDCEPFGRFLFQSPLGDIATTCMRSSTARLYEDLLLFAGAGAVSQAKWHRDSPWWPLSGQQLSTIWLSLEPVTAETGALRFVAGSHHDGDEAIGPMTMAELDPERRARVVVVEAGPGDVVVFHPRILHTSYGSAPDHPRRSFTIRFMGDDIRWRPRREMFHEWMRDCGLAKGDVLDHPWFPLVGTAPSRRSVIG